MKKISNYIIISLASLSLAFGLSPVYAFAGNNVPSCHHGDIGTNVTTMVPIYGRSTIYYVNGKRMERVWYKCTVCGYEDFFDLPY